MTVKEFKIQLALGTLSFNVKMILAKSPNTPKEILDILYTSKENDSNYLKHYSIKHCVAANPNYNHPKPKNRPGSFGP